MQALLCSGSGFFFVKHSFSIVTSHTVNTSSLLALEVKSKHSSPTSAITQDSGEIKTEGREVDEGGGGGKGIGISV